jgi:HPt (histidine-containing phosphotransfer) domain-containing protein
MAADDHLARELEALGAEYRASLPQRLTDIDAAWSAVRRGEAPALAPLLRGLHSIAGSALTFGLPELSKAAAAAEDWIEPYSERAEAPPAAMHSTFGSLLAAVRAAASG